MHLTKALPIMLRGHLFLQVINYLLKSLDIFYYCFFRGHGNESCNLIGSLPGQYFPISAHGPR